MTSTPPRGRRRGRSRQAPAPPVDELHPEAEPPDIRSFSEWELRPSVQEAIQAMGIEVPTPIQRLAIQPVLDGRDVIARAETGTGKTLAFGAPMMSRIDGDRATVLALVLCPTRELAQQVFHVLQALGEPQGIGVALVVGGDPMFPQVEALQAGAQVVVGTPGRVLDLYQQRFLAFPWTEFAVLDEADEMLEIGFIDDVRKILGACPDERQTLLFSATFPPELLRLAREHTRDPAEVATVKGVASVETIDHGWIAVDEYDRPRALLRLIGATEPDDVVLVFCDRRIEVDRLMRFMERSSHRCKALHGGFDQAARFRVMSAFREGGVKVLVATDVASRGLDVEHVTHVVNYSVPRGITDYTHRVGRTGRAGREGRAITFVGRESTRRWQALLRQMTWPVVELDGSGRPRGQRGSQHGNRDDAPPRERVGRDPAEVERRARRRDGEPDRRRGERRDEAPGGERGDRRRSAGGRRRGRRGGSRSESGSTSQERRRAQRNAPRECSPELADFGPPAERGHAEDAPRHGEARAAEARRDAPEEGREERRGRRRRRPRSGGGRDRDEPRGDEGAASSEPEPRREPRRGREAGDASSDQASSTSRNGRRGGGARRERSGPSRREDAPGPDGGGPRRRTGRSEREPERRRDRSEHPGNGERRAGSGSVPSQDDFGAGV